MELIMKNNNDNMPEVDVNRKNREDYENLMQNSSTNLDGYWDRNSIVVKLILLVLACIIVAGSLYYILGYLANK